MSNLLNKSSQSDIGKLKVLIFQGYFISLIWVKMFTFITKKQDHALEKSLDNLLIKNVQKSLKNKLRKLN